MSSSHAWSTDISSDELWAGTERFFLITFFFWTTPTACVLRLFMWSCCQSALQRKVKKLSRYHSVLWDKNWSTPDSKVTFGRGLSSVCTGLGGFHHKPVIQIWDVLFLKLCPPAGMHGSHLSIIYLAIPVDALHRQMQPKLGSKLQPKFQHLCSFILSLVLYFSSAFFEEVNRCIFNEHLKN